ncbi:MAG TPA: hypothetical protein VGM09_11880 [Bradyrhizobium sp.]|jgi:hypothetical protein
MATIRWIGGLSTVLMLSANGALCDEAAGAELPVPAKQAVQPTRPMGRTCIGTDGKAFHWDQPNVPFGAVCSFDEKAPAPNETERR